jgi:hypothetical protein
MSNLYRGPSIVGSYQVSVHMIEAFQRRRLKCEKLTDDRGKYSVLSFLKAEWKVSNTGSAHWTSSSVLCFVHQNLTLIKILEFFFYLRYILQSSKCKFEFTGQKLMKFFRYWPIRNKNCLWWPCLVMDMGQNVHSLVRTFHRCFLPSFNSFGWGFSEGKVKNAHFVPIG